MIGASDMAFRSITNVRAVTASIETARLWQDDYSDERLSPIDQFIENTDRINRIYLQYLGSGSPTIPIEVGSLIFLGYMSAVESYLRALLRGLINIDEVSLRLVEGKHVSFGAAIHHARDLLPEALMEDISLAADENVRTTFRELAGIKGHLPTEVRRMLTEYNKICHLRHCCVHRFGKLGTKNAIALGLDAHKKCLEKPLKLSVNDLQHIAEILRTFAKTINNYVFGSLLERTARNKNDQGTETLYAENWTWDYRSGGSRFRRYHNLFATTLDAHPSAPPKVLYDSFRETFADAARRQR